MVEALISDRETLKGGFSTFLVLLTALFKSYWQEKSAVNLNYVQLKLFTVSVLMSCYFLSMN